MLAPGLHCVETPTWLSAAWAGVLRGGPAAVLTGEAGAFLHGAVRDEPATILVRVAGPRKDLVIGQTWVRFLRGETKGRGSPPGAPLEECLVDIASTCDEAATVAAVTRAFAGRLTTPARLSEQLASTYRCGQRALMGRLCTAAASGIESVLEWRFDERVLRRHGLPTPERQVQTASGRVDALFREQGVIVELDGMRDHGNWSKDMVRDNAHAINQGLLTLRYGWWAVENLACETAVQLATVLRGRGWMGRRKACHDCRRVREFSV